MLKTVMKVPGDSFEERWSNLEERVRTHCVDVGWPFPQKTLRLIRPWFASVGDWFDRAAPHIQGRHPIEAPGSDDPALVILREFDDLLSGYAEWKDQESGWADRHGFPGEYEYDVGTIRHADGWLLDVLEGDDAEPVDVDPDLAEDLPGEWEYDEGTIRHPDGRVLNLDEGSNYPEWVRREAVSALTAFLDLTKSAVHRRRWNQVLEAVRERADREGKKPEEVLDYAVEEAICVAFVHFVKRSRSVEVDVSDWDIPRDTLVTSKDVVGVLSRNLIPGTVAPDLQPDINNWITEDMLGPDWRDRERDTETQAKVHVHARNLWHRQPNPEDQILSGLFARDLLSHDCLSQAQRAALRLQYEDMLFPREIAEKLGCSSSTVRTHLRRAHKKLRELAI